MKGYCISISDFMLGRIDEVGRASLMCLASRLGNCSHTAVSNTSCAHIVTSRCTSTVVKVETETEVSPVAEYEVLVWCWKAIRRMKETFPSLPGKGQMANGARSESEQGVQCTLAAIYAKGLLD